MTTLILSSAFHEQYEIEDAPGHAEAKELIENLDVEYAYGVLIDEHNDQYKSTHLYFDLETEQAVAYTDTPIQSGHLIHIASMRQGMQASWDYTIENLIPYMDEDIQEEIYAEWEKCDGTTEEQQAIYEKHDLDSDALFWEYALEQLTDEHHGWLENYEYDLEKAYEHEYETHSTDTIISFFDGEEMGKIIERKAEEDEDKQNWKLSIDLYKDEATYTLHEYDRHGDDEVIGEGGAGDSQTVREWILKN